MKERDLGRIGFDSRSNRTRQKGIDDYLAANMRRNPICRECFKEFENYSVIESGMMKGTPIKNPDICQNCMAKGWSEATLNDTKL